MPTGGPVTEGAKVEKPPAAKQVHGDDRGIQSWKHGRAVTPEAVFIHEGRKEPEVDEFGLPVKPPRRRTNEDIPKNEDSGIANGTYSQDTSQLSSISNKIGDHRQSEESDLPPDKLEITSNAIDSPRHNKNAATIPITSGIPNSIADTTASGISGWSHQTLAPRKEAKDNHHEEETWQDMPALAQYDLYDDNGRLIAREAHDSDEEANAYTGLGGAGKGYTRVQIDEDAQSATSMDENTDYLFKQQKGEQEDDDDTVQRDPLAQMQATKDLLTEGQRIAYVGVTRLAMATMTKELNDIEETKGTKKELRLAVESMKMWSQQMMVRLYSHMEIDSSGIVHILLSAAAFRC